MRTRTPRPRATRTKVYIVTADRTTVYRVTGTSPQNAIDRMIDGAGEEVEGETHNIAAEEEKD